MIAEQAPAIPCDLGQDGPGQLQGRRSAVVNGYYTTHDLSFTSLK